MFRFAVSLHQRRKAQEAGVVFLEGLRFCEDVLESGFSPQMVFFTKNKEALVSGWEERFSSISGAKLYLLEDHLFEKLSETKNPQGVALVVARPDSGGELPVCGEDIYLVCEKTADPGNLGTMIRMADAFCFSAVLLVEGSVDPYNEKVMRASMGSCFRIPILLFASIEELGAELKVKGIRLLGMHLDGESMDEAVFPFPCAMVIGNEAAGMSEAARGLCDWLVRIPMEGAAESLNAASAASIAGYVLAKQRRGGR